MSDQIPTNARQGYFEQSGNESGAKITKKRGRITGGCAQDDNNEEEVLMDSAEL